MNKIFLVLIFALLSFNIVNAVSIHPNFYDLYLNKQTDVGFEINTESNQTLISKTADYSLNGYVADEISDKNSLYALLFFVFVVVFVAFVLFIVYLKIRRMAERDFYEQQDSLVLDAESEKDDVKEVLDFITKHSGRVTQKDVHKQFSSSEAKISLILTDLESKGVIQKIKKGRGNVIILK